MTKFKVGDRVVRTESKHGGMSVGDVGEVTGVNSYGEVMLKEFIYWHNMDNLELYEEVPKYPNKPHIHAEYIKAWADGAEIETISEGNWRLVQYPMWYIGNVYRIKPEDNGKQEQITNIRKKMEELTKELKELESE